MATYFIDLDGTILKHSTQEPLEGAIAWLKHLKAEGHEVILITRRSNEEWGAKHPKYSETVTARTLREHDIPHDGILWGVQSPRVIVDDDVVKCIMHPRNEPWKEPYP